MALAYGAAASGDQERATRRSVLIGTDGIVERIFEKPDPPGHADEILAALDDRGDR